MANMSYCRFQNTLPDLRDCYEAMNDGLNLNDMDKDEARACRKLIRLCTRIADDYGDEAE